MKRIRKVFHLLHFNGRTFLAFEILYKLVGVTFAIPLLYGAFDLMMRVSGYQYLTMENIRKFIRHPLLYLFLAIALLAVAVYTFLDLSAVIYLLHASREERKVSLSDTLWFLLKNLREVLLRGNRRLLLWILLILIYCCIGQIPEILFSLAVPNVLLMASRQLRRILFGLVIALLLGLIPYIGAMFSIHTFTLENLSGKEAVRKSRRISRRSMLRNFFFQVLIQTGLYAAYLLLMAIGIFLVVLFGKIFARAEIVSSLSVSFAQIVITVLLVVFSLLGVPVNGVLYSLLYYQYAEKNGESVPTQGIVERSRGIHEDSRRAIWRRKHGTLVTVLSLITLIVTSVACVTYVYQLHKGEWNRNVEYLKTMEVTAHRGASYEYPENTMAAFQGALENGADWIELDVRLSADDQLFVMHDRSFYRTTGVDAYAWELTYEEISELDAGSMFGSEFAGERIPLLEEVIDFAKENSIRLNIEIKPSSYEEGIVELLVELIQEKEFADRCVVTSQAYDSIRQVKLLDENITTVYVMSLAYGDINRMKYADAFSVRASSISNALVSSVHNNGKQIYAWTVNTRDTINLMINRQVDNIITDDVLLAKKCIGSKMNSSVVNDYINMLNRQLRLGTFLF